MRLAVLLLALAPCWGQLQIRYFQQVDTVEKVVAAKKLPTDLDGYVAIACNLTAAPVKWNPDWVILLAEPLQYQDSALVMLAASIARQDSLWPRLLRGTKKTVVVGGISFAAAAATGGLSIPAEIIVGGGIGTALLPSLAKEYASKIAINRPTNWLVPGAQKVHDLAAGDCENWAFAAAKGGPSIFTVSTGSPAPPPAPAPAPPAPAPLAPALWSGRTEPQSSTWVAGWEEAPAAGMTQ